jgi:hypothetical protein
VPRHPPNALIALEIIVATLQLSVVSFQLSETTKKFLPQPSAAATSCTEAKHESVASCQWSVSRKLLETANWKLETSDLLLGKHANYLTQHITTSLIAYRRGLGGRNIAAPTHPVRLG